jgi:hypothetical protein
MIEFLPTEGARAMLLVVPIPRIEPFDHGELAHLALAQLGPPDAVALHITEGDRDGGLFARPDRAAFEFVGAVHGPILRARRILQSRQLLVQIAIAVELVEGRDHAPDQHADQIEQRIADLKDAEAAPFAFPLGFLQARLRGVVVRVPLGANASLVERSYILKIDHAVRRAQIAGLFHQQQAGRRRGGSGLLLIGLQGQVGDEWHGGCAHPVEACGRGDQHDGERWRVRLFEATASGGRVNEPELIEAVAGAAPIDRGYGTR